MSGPLDKWVEKSPTERKRKIIVDSEEEEAVEQEFDADTSDEEIVNEDGQFAPNAFIDDEAEGSDEDDDEEIEETEEDQRFINDEEELVQGGINFEDVEPGDVKEVQLSIKDLYCGTSVRAVYRRPDTHRRAVVDVVIPPRTPPGTVLRSRHLSIRVVVEPEPFSDYTVEGTGQLSTTVIVPQFTAWVGPDAVWVKTPDGKRHKVKNLGRSQLREGDVLLAPFIGFGSGELICRIKVTRDRKRLSAEDRQKVEAFVESL